ncbi:multidrug resistance-associated protein 1-like isoform X2 [Sceloporus undulatus]|uniref:multidrug resistance-associated protein 1-like isoform X2 n=1 Tax=Sceloporus undulatus TaxID=8520 RepID=UPI001C4DC036|nr:multidrug resistance-associated protein 1-like isoform X2 [Sceloporus undulatus]
MPGGRQGGRKKCSPEENASFYSKLTYSWFSRLMTLGYKKPLEREDLFELNESDSAYNVCPVFEKQWRKENFKSTKVIKTPAYKDVTKKPVSPKPSLLSPLWQTFKLVLVKVAVLKVAADILAFTSPQIMKEMILQYEHHSDSYSNDYGYALALFLVVILQTLVHQVYHRLNILTAVKIKTAVVGLVYKKALNLSSSSRQKYTTGEIVNLMSADIQQLMELTLNLNLLWSAPFQILLAIIFLWQELGPSVLAGKNQMKNSDQQIKLLNEILHGIKILKLYAWEPSYQRKIVEIRECEIDVLKSTGYLTTLSMLTLTCIPFLVSLATFGVYFLLDEENILTAAKVFTSLSLFNILRLPLFDLPTVISSVAQTKVSLSRMEDFLSSEDLDPQNINTDCAGDYAVRFVNASFCWKKIGASTLNKLNLEIPEGSLVVVVGQVGAGKSSLLSAILGEMEKTEGTAQRKGSVAYVSQQAWIQNATVLENILFGSELNQLSYERVLEACALLPDLDQLPTGDQTEIGERGINISGGQKQRVSLARAVYSNADIYLLDDPLSAVDVHVGKHLFEKVIGSTGLLKNKTRVLVTHNLTLLPQTDFIVVMEDGRITEMGSYKELLSKGANFAKLVLTFGGGKEDEETSSLSKSCPKDIKIKDYTLPKKMQYLEHKDRSMFSMKKEKVAVGAVKMSVILKYLQAFGWLWMWLTIAACLGQNAVAIGQNMWLSTWTKDAKEIKDFTEWKHLRNYKLSIYGLLGFIQGLTVCCGSYVVTRGLVCASRALHRQMLHNVLRLPLQYFETNPVGQIINRFTKDMFIVDIRFHYYLRTWLNCTLDVVGTILVIVFVSPLFILVVVPLGYLYFTIQRYYISSSRQIRRLAGASQSPIISHFSETLLGVSTIRAYGHEERFIAQNKDVINENLVCFYNNVIANRWLAVRLEFLGNLMVFFAALFAMFAGNKIDSATMGLSISYALNITQSLNFWVRKACEIEANGVSIERVCEYAKIDKEAPWILSNRPPVGWPNEGVIQFVNYQVRYRSDLDLALQDISFQSHSEEKIGIIGRTGAGKSTLTNCLFRILERAGGKIIIDGIDIATIGLHDLRGNLNIIPQDPVLFSGTLQSNLDPLGKYSDLELWEALELCDLKNFVQSLPKKLLHEISEGGENLSVGQRQLVCLARALLRKTKVLILDEATASVDIETDNLVQATIRKEFRNCTVLTIAHRLHSIMDSDRVLVLDSGRIAEFDTPARLLQQKGMFYEMVSKAGILQEDS